MDTNASNTKTWENEFRKRQMLFEQVTGNDKPKICKCFNQYHEICLCIPVVAALQSVVTCSCVIMFFCDGCNTVCRLCASLQYNRRKLYEQTSS